MRIMNSARNLHSFVWLAFAPRAAWRMAESRSDAARKEWILTLVALMLLPQLILYTSTTLYVNSALADLPNTSQSTIVRQRLLAFKKPASRFAKSTPPWIAAVVLVALLSPKHIVLVVTSINVLVLTALALRSVVLVRKSLRSHRKEPSQLRTLQVIPAAGRVLRSLEECEAAGRAEYISEETAGDSRVLGVSLALLRKFAQEKDIPADYTMAQVCAELIKPVTVFDKISASNRSTRRRSTRLSAERAKLRLHPLPVKQVHCSYALLLGEATDAEGRPYISQATRFVSYAW